LAVLVKELSVQPVGKVSTTVVVPFVLLLAMMLWAVIWIAPVEPCVKVPVCAGVTVTSGAGSTIIRSPFELTPVVIALPVITAVLVTVAGAVAVALTLKLSVSVGKLFPDAMKSLLLQLIDWPEG